MRPTRILAAAAFSVLPVVAAAQVSDTLQLGDRVRVRVASTRGTTDVFTGNIASISPDTLVLAIPGGKGTIILPRASINEVAKSDGYVSRWVRLPIIAPLVVSSAMITSTLTRSSSRDFQTRGTLILGLNAALITRYLSHPSPERWRPVESWLNR